MHNEVHRLDQLARSAKMHGLPNSARRGSRADDAGHERTLITSYVEVQLWSGEPIRRYLGGRPRIDQED